MKTILVITLLLISSASGHAAKIRDIKCSDLSSGTENVTPEYVAVTDGYNKAGKEVSEEVDMAGIVTQSKKINEKCAGNSSAKIEAIKKHVKRAKPTPSSATSINPLKAKCSDFVALREDIQPVAVYWVAGHDKAGKLKNGEVDEEFLAQPVATLIEDCKTQPTASFYGKTKTWLKAHL